MIRRLAYYTLAFLLLLAIACFWVIITDENTSRNQRAWEDSRVAIMQDVPFGGEGR